MKSFMRTMQALSAHAGESTLVLVALNQVQFGVISHRNWTVGERHEDFYENKTVLQPLQTIAGFLQDLRLIIFL